jgi:hypothetical protein
MGLRAARQTGSRARRIRPDRARLLEGGATRLSSTF